MGQEMELTKENVALIAALGVFAGTLINALINYLQHKSKQSYEWKSERNRKKIEKGEVLYESLLLFKKLVFANHMKWIACIDGDIHPSELSNETDEILKKNPEYNGIGNKITLISGIYFPEIGIKYEKARELLRPANSVMFQTQTSGVKDKNNGRNTILNAGHKFDSEIDEILSLLSKEIRAL